MMDEPVLQALNFQVPMSDVSGMLCFEQVSVATCVLCTNEFTLPTDKDSLLKHLATVHKLVIANVHLVANLGKYLDYWRRRFQALPLTDFCAVIKTNCKETDPAPSELYYLLCDTLPEDRQLRIKLHSDQLEMVLAQQQTERADTSFSRNCLFCTNRFEGNRSELFNHMAQFHNFSVGHPDNLVFTNEFLDILEQKLESLQCLYCEKTFKSQLVLKEHMRKKGHKRLNSQNVAYNRFYTVNYLELGKSWQDLELEVDIPDAHNTNTSANDWEDWVEVGGTAAVCLFCDFSSVSHDTLVQHMTDTHSFDLHRITRELNLNFYQKVKLVNYIRRQIHQNCCVYCMEKCSQPDKLLEHMTSTGHISVVPNTTVWDQPQYFFPTYEDDGLLYSLVEPTEDEQCTISAGVLVLPEDLPGTDIILLQHLSDVVGQMQLNNETRPITDKLTDE